MQWKTPRPIQSRSIRIRTEYGHADLWARTCGDAGELAILFRHSGAYASPALLLSVADKLRNLAGNSPTMTLTPVPSEWSNGELLRSFGAAGFRVRQHHRSVELACEMEVWDALNRAAVVSCALDPKARFFPALQEKARHAALHLGLSEALAISHHRKDVDGTKLLRGAAHQITTHAGGSIQIENWDDTK